MELYFPEKFKSSKIDQYSLNAESVKKMLLEVRQIRHNQDYSKEIEDREKVILAMNTPNSWNIHVKGNLEIVMTLDYEKYLFSIGEHTNESLKDISMYRFYALESYITQKVKSLKNGNRSNN